MTTIALKKNIKTNQQAFDAVCRHLAKQKERAIDNSNCRYSTDEGKRCAVGALVTVGDARKCEQRYGGNDVQYIGLELGEVDVELLASLQHDHDTANRHQGVQGIRNRLRFTADNFGLDSSKVDLITEWRG